MYPTLLSANKGQKKVETWLPSKLELSKDNLIIKPGTAAVYLLIITQVSFSIIPSVPHPPSCTLFVSPFPNQNALQMNNTMNTIKSSTVVETEKYYGKEEVHLPFMNKI